jgi:DNA-binding transcriptional ArsR family regulator
MKSRSYNDFFMNFASRSKFDIITALRKRPMNVTEITQQVKGEQSAVSHNLAHLTKCQILSVKREGKQRVYSINRDTVIPMLETVERHVKKHCLGRCGK